MARRAAIDRASMAQISMCVGIASFLLALTFRRVRREYRNRHRVSGRARALMGEQLPAHIAEHLARMGDPDYICLAIAENKLTVRVVETF